MHLLQYTCVSARVFVCLSLLSFHFTFQSLTQKWKIFLPYKVSQSPSLCSASIFLTLSIPFHIKLLDKFVHVTAWELREQSAWWVTWNFSVIPFHFLILSIRERTILFSRSVSQSLSLCMETDHQFSLCSALESC